MCQVLLGPCSLIQGALAKILKHTPPEFFEAINRKLEVMAFDHRSTIDLHGCTLNSKML